MKFSIKGGLTTLFTAAAAGILVLGTAPAASSTPVTPSTMETAAHVNSSVSEGLVSPAAVCAPQTACFYSGVNHTGTVYQWTPGNGCRANGVPTWSGINNTGYSIEVFSGPNCTGTKSYANSTNYGFSVKSVFSCAACRGGN